MFRGFYDDPFFGFNDHQHRRRHFNEIEDGEGQDRSSRGRFMRELAVPDIFDHHAMFSRDPFNAFDSMMSNMSNMTNMTNGAFSESYSSGNQDGFGYSSFQVSSYTDDGSGQPKVFQAHTSTRHAPGGIKEIQKSLRDSEVGVEKMAIGRHIRDRGHVITREKNMRSGDMREDQDCIGFRDEEVGQFDQDWKKETKAYGGSRGKHLKEHKDPSQAKLEYKSGHHSKH